MTELTKDFWDRVGKTFVEGFLAALIASLTKMDWENVFSSENGYKILISVLIGAIAMAISATWNGVISPIMKIGAEEKPENEHLSSGEGDSEVDENG